MKLNWFEKRLMNSPIRRLMQRQEASLLRKLGGEVAGGHVLEIGCGRGVGIEIILDFFRPLTAEAFDLDPDQVRLAKRRLEIKYRDRVKVYDASATSIPAADESFDAVFDFGVLHHIPGNSRALSEIARVLKPQGRLFFVEPLASVTLSLPGRLLTDHPPEAQFTTMELLEKLAASGLRVAGHSHAIGATEVVGVAWKNAPGGAP